MHWKFTFSGDSNFHYRPPKSIVSRNQCCGILLGLVIWVIVLLPIILSWTALSVASPQRPLVWTTANYNQSTQSVAIKVNNCNKIPFSIDSLSINKKLVQFFFNLVNCFERKPGEDNFRKPSFCRFQSKIKNKIKNTDDSRDDSTKKQK